MWGHLLNDFSLNWVRVDSNGDQLFFCWVLGNIQMSSFPSSDSKGKSVGWATFCQQLEGASSAPWKKNITSSSCDLIRMLWPDEINGHLWQAGGNTLLLKYWYRTWILSAFSCSFITSLYKGYWVVFSRSLSIEKLCGFFFFKAGQKGSNILTCNLSTWEAKSGLARPLSG